MLYIVPYFKEYNEDQGVHLCICMHLVHIIIICILPLLVKTQEKASSQVTISHTSAYRSSTHHCLCCTSCRKEPEDKVQVCKY